MAKRGPPPRVLKYDDFAAVMADVEGLLEQGYERHGNWTLGQACSHIADWACFPMDGFPKPPLLVRCVMWLMKVTVAPRMRRRILSEGFKPGLPTAPDTVPDAAATSDEAGVEKLRETLERLANYEGDLQPSPLFGPMDKATLERVTLLHAAHHLGYLEPRPAA